MLLARVDAKTCSARCRKAWSRRGLAIPHELTSHDRWIRRSATKMPLTVRGAAASSTDPTTWATFSEAVESQAGVGLGFVLNGDGLGCYDLDHCFTNGVLSAAAESFVKATPHFYAEVSPSGDGLHLWVFADSQRGWKRTIDGLRVEFYTRGRYMTVTGQRA